MHLTVKSQWGDAPRWMFDEALTANPKSTVSGKLLYVDSEQKKMDIDIQRVSYLESDRTAVLCREQMARGDLFQPACLNVTLRAGYLDHYRCEAEFDRLEPAFLNLTAAAYARARDLFEPHVRENPLHRGEPGRAQAEVRFADGFHAVDVALSGPSFAARFEKLRMTRQVRPFVVVHPEYNFVDRVRQYRFVNENNPKCVLDKTTVNTFDNTTYNIRLGPCWHNMSIITKRGIGNMTIQARDSGDERILRVLFPEGSELELRKSQRFYRSRESARSAPLYVNGNLVMVFQDSPVSFDIQYREFHSIVELSLITGNLFH
ncbi:Vitellogenin-2, partial [Gryllus bimaculatus]